MDLKSRLKAGNNRNATVRSGRTYLSNQDYGLLQLIKIVAKSRLLLA